MPFGTLLVVGLGLVAGTEDEPQIRHTALQCLPDSQYAQVDAVILPGPEIQTAKVYFRSDQYPDYYYVEMKGTAEDNFQAVLPKPSPETQHVIYYVEAISHSFNSARTAEHDPEVGTEDECERQTGRAPLFMSAPRIIIGAVKAGAPAIPPGFQAAGIVGFVSAAGVASGAAGGGIGVGTAVVVGAAGAGAAGVAVAASGNSDSSGSASSGSPPASTTTTTAVATTTSTTTSSTTTTAVNTVPKACVVTTPIAPVIVEGDTIRFDASCSTGDRLQEDTVSTYEWDLGDGRTRSGRVITVVYNTAGSYTVTLTVTDQAGNQDVFRMQVTVNARFVPPAPPAACFTYADLGIGCQIGFDASCSTGVIDKYDWILDKTAVFGPPVSTSGQVVTYNFGFSCIGQTITVQLTVTGPDGTADVTSQLVPVMYLTNPFQQSLELESSVGAFLGVRPFDGTARGDIVLNGVRVGGVDSAGATDARFRGKPGVNTLEVTSNAEQEGFLRLDWSGAAHFVPGSIKIEYGTVISLDDRTVVFRLNGAPGERLKLTYQLLP